MIDLHCHSSCSDGTDPPERLARLAVDAGLTAVALTDHDTVAGFDAFDVACADLGVRAIRAAEISCLDEGRSVHVLCYFISDDEDSELRRLLATLSGDRERRNEALLERLAELGYDRVTIEEVRASGDELTTSIGRPHFANALLRLYPAEFSNLQGVFDALLGSKGAAYVDKAHVSVAEASAAARADGALTSLAHPLITLMPDVGSDDRTLDAIERRVEPVLERLVANGLTGLESYYSRHDKLETQLLASLARRHGVVPTGGSDYHGSVKPDLVLGRGTGSLAVPDELLDELEATRPHV
ncbi:MAG TPA: PHP domain-containing protein [Acidimicrobiales bacterium]|nr:PHP domain-containing protein [Acidimicrobiales bacterium]